MSNNYRKQKNDNLIFIIFAKYVNTNLPFMFCFIHPSFDWL